MLTHEEQQTTEQTTEQAGAKPAHPVIPTTRAWQNWSRSIPPSNAQLETPADGDALLARIKQANHDPSARPVRPVGAGHSWTDLVPNDTSIIRADSFTGLGEIDKDKNRAWLGAGTRLRELSPLLAAQGLAFRNLGDIDVQTLAGAVSTATHGTGRTLPALSAEITGLRMVTGGGEFLEISDGQNADMLEAARVALGSLGVLTEIQMQLVPRYKLHRRVWFERHDSLLGRADSLWQENRNFEFFYLPFSGQSMAITHNETDAADTPRKKDDDGSAVMQLKSVRDYFSWFPALRKHLLARALSRAREENVIGESWQLLSTDRNVLFNEMEYHLPVNEGLEALEEVRRFIEKKRPDIFFPFEARRTSGDTAWLSPFQGEERISVAVHCYAEDAFEFLFTDIEPIFLRRGGRPHWGKLNRLDFATAQSLYPDFDRFRDFRHRLDPNGVMLNPYLANLFGVTQ